MSNGHSKSQLGGRRKENAHLSPTKQSLCCRLQQSSPQPSALHERSEKANPSQSKSQLKNRSCDRGIAMGISQENDAIRSSNECGNILHRIWNRKSELFRKEAKTDSSDNENPLCYDTSVVSDDEDDDTEIRTRDFKHPEGADAYSHQTKIITGNKSPPSTNVL